MPGGIYILVAYGAQDTYLTGGNPDVNHFKYVLKTHIHHAKEPVELSPDGYNGPPERIRNIDIKFPIERVGDLLYSANLLFTLPALRIPDHAEDTSGFSQVRWVKCPGMALIEEMKVIVGGTEVQTLDSERLLTLTEIDLRDEERETYNLMVGNIPELTNPTIGVYRRNSGTVDPSGNTSFYPYAKPDDDFSIPETRVRVPTMFWFTRHISEALPVGFLTRHEAEIILRLKPWNKLLQVRKTEDDDWAPPPSDFDLNEYLSVASNYSWNPNPIIEGVYYFLNNDYRNEMARQEIRVPVYQLRRYDETTTQNRSYFAEAASQPTISGSQLSSVSFRVRQETNPVSRIMCMARRIDFIDNNDWMTLGNWLDESTGRDQSDNLLGYEKPIIQSFTLQFNGNDVFDKLPREYLTRFDPYAHSKGRGNEGIACYSFGIENKPEYTSGTVNFGRIRDPIITIDVTPATIAPSGYSVMVLVESVNWFKYTSGFAGLIYST